LKQRILKNFEAELADKKRMEEARRKQDTAKDNIENQRRALSQELGSKKPASRREGAGGGGGTSALEEEEEEE
jgi:hypothetical protein